MKRSLLFVFAVSILTLTLPCSSYAASAEPLTLTGYVLDETSGVAVPGVLVTLHADDAIAGSTRTDLRGQFSFANLAPDRGYEISAARLGIATVSLSLGSLSATNTVVNVFTRGVLTTLSTHVWNPSLRASGIDSLTPWVMFVPGIAPVGPGRLPM